MNCFAYPISRLWACLLVSFATRSMNWQTSGRLFHRTGLLCVRYSDSINVLESKISSMSWELLVFRFLRVWLAAGEHREPRNVDKWFLRQRYISDKVQCGPPAKLKYPQGHLWQEPWLREMTIYMLDPEWFSNYLRSFHVKISCNSLRSSSIGRNMGTYGS